ncbi:MAG: hypothetical protein CBB71_03730 [Rhodopirellula sp. TMED11]|nr:MAG: hypothetical protein CBB71_03730 [Rhodopirellula sp. TMED11]
MDLEDSLTERVWILLTTKGVPNDSGLTGEHRGGFGKVPEFPGKSSFYAHQKVARPVSSSEFLARQVVAGNHFDTACRKLRPNRFSAVVFQRSPDWLAFGQTISGDGLRG